MRSLNHPPGPTEDCGPCCVIPSMMLTSAPRPAFCPQDWAVWAWAGSLVQLFRGVLLPTSQGFGHSFFLAGFLSVVTTFSNLKIRFLDICTPCYAYACVCTHTHTVFVSIHMSVGMLQILCFAAFTESPGQAWLWC